MSKTYFDLDSEERGDFNNFIYKNEKVFRMAETGRAYKIKGFGLCATCNNFMYARSEFKTKVARCYKLHFELYKNDPIEECSWYEKMLCFSLSDMKEIALFIDNDKKQIGFIKEEEEIK